MLYMSCRTSLQGLLQVFGALRGPDFVLKMFLLHFPPAMVLLTVATLWAPLGRCDGCRHGFFMSDHLRRV